MAIFKKIVLLFCISFVSFYCSKGPNIIDDSMIDGKIIFDPSLYNPSKYLVSYANANPSAVEAEKPVVIVSHGYSASTFEWDEYRKWAETSGFDFKISQLLLNGHGRSYQEFKSSTWKDWRQSIIDEYERLVKANYKNISFAGSSTSGALLLELISSGYFDSKPIKPKNFFLVDPIVIPGNKTLSLVKMVGPMLGYVESGNTLEQDKVYYHFRPQETLQSLNDLITIVRKRLERGVTLDNGCNIKVYKSKKDASADPVSAVLIYKGIKTSSGDFIEIEMVDSDLHVFTNLGLRENLNKKDSLNQTNAFLDMTQRLVR